MNKLVLVGNLSKDVEIKTVKVEEKEVSLARVSLAVHSERGGEANFFAVEVWGKEAENCAKYLAKGSKIACICRVENNNYESNGEKVYAYNFIAEGIEFLSAGKKD